MVQAHSGPVKIAWLDFFSGPVKSEKLAVHETPRLPTNPADGPKLQEKSVEVMKFSKYEFPGHVQVAEHCADGLHCGCYALGGNCEGRHLQAFKTYRNLFISNLYIFIVSISLINTGQSLRPHRRRKSAETLCTMHENDTIWTRMPCQSSTRKK